MLCSHVRLIQFVVPAVEILDWRPVAECRVLPLAIIKDLDDGSDHASWTGSAAYLQGAAFPGS
jgi:hypothetical protein